MSPSRVKGLLCFPPQLVTLGGIHLANHTEDSSMDQQKVDMLMMSYGKYFEGYQLVAIRERLLAADDAKLLQLQAAGLKDPVMMLVISIIGGHFGIDRFVLGDVGLGVAKLITCGGLGIWTIVDWFIIMGKTRETNMQKLALVLG